uniref:DNA-directed RNA polymerase n=1 Tax=Calocybe gambosa TaxID=56469 RepID=A0A8F1ACT7_9AGAR|nr:RNA polymerase [Calocybe gambosa]
MKNLSGIPAAQRVGLSVAAAGGTFAIVETVKRVIPAISDNSNMVEEIKEEIREMVENEREKRNSVQTSNSGDVSTMSYGEEGSGVNVRGGTHTESSVEGIKGSYPMEDDDGDFNNKNKIEEDIESPDQSFINSPLEKYIPLLVLLKYLVVLNKLEIMFIFIIIMIIFNKYFYSQIVKYISKLFLKKGKVIFAKKLSNIEEKIYKIQNYNKKFYNFMLVVILLLFLITKILNIYITIELFNKIDDYILVYNYINAKSSLLAICGYTHNSNILVSLNKGVSSFISCNHSYGCNGSLVGLSNNSYYRFYVIGSGILHPTNRLRMEANVLGSESWGNFKNKVRYFSYNKNINLNELNNSLLTIPFENRFGRYAEYLRQNVTLEFILKYYPQYKDNNLFLFFINELPPKMRVETDTINKLFDLILQLNTSKEKLMLYSNLLPNKVLLDIFKDVRNFRKNLTEILMKLKFSPNEIDNLLVKIGSKINISSLRVKSVSTTEIEHSDLFIESWTPIYKYLSVDFKLYEELINKDKDIFINIIILIQLCIDHNIGGITNITNLTCYKSFLDKLQELSKNDLTKVKSSKKKTKIVRTSPGELNSVVYFKLIEMKNYIENIIRESIFKNIDYNGATLEIKTSVEGITQSFYSDLDKDYNNLIYNYAKAINITDFLYNISRDLSDDNINFKFNKFIEYIRNKNFNMDELYKIANLINSDIKKDITIGERQKTLSTDSKFFIELNNILSNKNIEKDENKQMLLEKFILDYERNFILNMINNIDHSIENYKLLARIYKHSTPQFYDRIKTYILEHVRNNSQLYQKNKEKFNDTHSNIVLALFLILKVEDIVNILFSKVIKMIGSSRGITQTQLIGQLADEMLILFKYNSGKIKDLEPEKLLIVTEVKAEIDKIPVEVKMQFGKYLFDILTEEFSYIFNKNLIYENNESHIYINISKEYLSILSSVMFNPINIPMISKPKLWSQQEIGGYLLSEFNELNKNNDIIRNNPNMRDNSLVSDKQIDTVNYLNSIPFEINKTMLNYLLQEWKKDNSIIFKNYNKLINTETDNNNLDSTQKKEIFQHNSIHWNYSNILNIALLLKNNTLYLPTFLDFRGRVYPTPVYLSYQGSDLARSLLLFKDVNNKIEFEDKVSNILNKDITDRLKRLNLNDIDYVKLYLANVFGLNKLSRKNRIKWFDQNIDEILNLLYNDIELFNINYLIKAKEPAQFISCLMEYNNFIKRKIKDIKTPILFDATCSGVQHLSALTTDIEIAKLVNIIESNKDEPSDFYSFCVQNIITNIENLPNNDEHFKSKLLKLNLNRTILKHSIMTVPYNVTSIGIADKLSEHFSKKFIELEEVKILISKNLIESKYDLIENRGVNTKFKGMYIYRPLNSILKINKSEEEDIIFTQSELNKFGNIVKQTVLSIIPPFNNLRKYFDNIIEILNILDLPIYWITPSGMSISLSSMKMIQKKIKSNKLKLAKPITILIPTDTLDYTSIKTGLMPNFIHSLDASNIHMLIKLILELNIKNINLYTIHDCFATDYKNIALLEVLIKKSFADLYFNQNYLNFIHESFLKQIEEKIEIFLNYKEGKEEPFILIDTDKIHKSKVKLINKKNSTLTIKYLNKHVQLFLPKLPEYKWEVNKNIIEKELYFNEYFIS